MTTLQDIKSQLDRMETMLKTLVPDDSSSVTHHIVQLEHYISGSGNPTWKAFTANSEIVYLRQAHRELLTSAGMWDGLQDMDIGDVWQADFKLECVRDGDFWKPIRVHDGWFIAVEDDEPFEPVEGPEVLDMMRETVTLESIVRAGDFVVLDTETTDLHGQICQIAIVDALGNTLLDTLVRPTVPIAPGATVVHGITDEMVATAPTLNELAHDIMIHISEANVICWNAEYDRGCLTTHVTNARVTIPLADMATWHDAMTPFAAVYGDWSEYHGNYKWQKLTTAARYYGLDTSGAHSALADARMTLQVLREMYLGASDAKS